MVSIISEEGHKKFGIYEYVIDTAAEIADISSQAKAGSIAYCIENSKTYMKNHSGEFVEVNFKKGGSGGEGGTTNYTELSNKPQINGVTLDGNKTTADLSLFSGSYTDLTNKPAYSSENWVFTLDDNSTVTKKVVIEL